ncbi:MAG: sugar transporter [Muribaculaceae bacterium]|nr:sugar transporter [Muribaculaceae bacterium]
MNYSASKTTKSVKNGLVAMSFFVITIFIQFYSRKIFLVGLGADILGLTSTLVNMLEFLNLAELGVGTAIGFSLFKPLSLNDYQSVNEIVTFQGLLYRRIAILILVCAIVLSCFFPLIFEKSGLPLWYAYASFFTMLFSSMIGYFFNYRQVILSSSQQEYRIIYSYRLTQLIKIIFQMTAVYYSNFGYIWWVILEAVFVVISAVALHYVTQKAFPDLKTGVLSYKELSLKYGKLRTKIKQLFFHKIGSFALYQSSPLIIYAFISLNEVTLYMNYMLISAGILQLFNAIYNGVGAGVGNVVAQGDWNYSKTIFNEIFSLRFVSSWIVFVTFFMTAGSFVTFWIGADYILPMNTTILIGIILFLNLIRYTVDIYIQANGIYGDIYAPISEAVINLTLSISLGYLMGLNGILTGIIISQIAIVILWKPYYLLSKFPIFKFRRYILKLLSHFLMSIICTIPSLILYHLIDIHLYTTGFYRFITLTIILFTSLIVSNGLGFYITGSPFKNALFRLKSIRSLK